MAADIDINFSFTNDTKNYWEVFDRQKSSQNCPDPDYYSPRLRTYHQKLWSKKLPNGEMMELKEDANYLVWKDFHFGSDSIVNMYFHHIKAQKLLTDEIKKHYAKNTVLMILHLSGKTIYCDHTPSAEPSSFPKATP